MVVTRSIIPDHFTHLQEWNDVIIGGWGKTGKRLTEPETSKLLKDCEEYRKIFTKRFNKSVEELLEKCAILLI